MYSHVFTMYCGVCNNMFQVYALQCQKEAVEAQLRTRDTTIESLRQQHQQQMGKVSYLLLFWFYWAVLALILTKSAYF